MTTAGRPSRKRSERARFVTDDILDLRRSQIRPMAEQGPPDLPLRDSAPAPGRQCGSTVLRASAAVRRAAIAAGVVLVLAGPLVLSTVASFDKGGWVVVPAALAFAWVGATLLMVTSRT